MLERIKSYRECNKSILGESQHLAVLQLYCFPLRAVRKHTASLPELYAATRLHFMKEFSLSKSQINRLPPSKTNSWLSSSAKFANTLQPKTRRFNTQHPPGVPFDTSIKQHVGCWHRGCRALTVRSPVLHTPSTLSLLAATSCIQLLHPVFNPASRKQTREKYGFETRSTANPPYLNDHQHPVLETQGRSDLLLFKALPHQLPELCSVRKAPFNCSQAFGSLNLAAARQNMFCNLARADLTAKSSGTVY